MKFTSKLKSFILSSVLILSVFVFANSTNAQTIGSMPVLYNSASQSVNTLGGTLPAGTYYLGIGATVPVVYAGDGTYFNPATDMYGGSVYNPTGAAGFYTIPGTMGTSVGLPNTGAGGNATALWGALTFAFVLGIGGVLYLSKDLSHHASSN